MNIDVAQNYHLVVCEDGNDIWTKKSIHHQFSSSYQVDEGLIKIEDAATLNSRHGLTGQDATTEPDHERHGPATAWCLHLEGRTFTKQEQSLVLHYLNNKWESFLVLNLIFIYR